MRKYLDAITTVILLVCAITVAGLAVQREIGAQRAARSLVGGARPAQYKNWRSFAAVGRRVGPEGARATVVEFVDYECPFCKRFHSDLSGVVADMNQQHRGAVAVLYVPFPLPTHRFAKISGQAAECAADQGRFTEMQSLLFAKQDSFGLKPWSEYGHEAGVTNPDLFSVCMKDPARARRVDQGLALAESLKLPGTPTVLVNGWQFVGVPSREQLRGALERALRNSGQVAAVTRSASPPAARTGG